MINREATIRWKGYSPDDLSTGSWKRVWANCDGCGKGRWLPFGRCNSLCRSCACGGENNSKHKPKIKITCTQCNKEFEVIPSLANKQRFCSLECKGKWQSKNTCGKKHPNYKPKIKIACAQCSKEFEVPPSNANRRFCSSVCMGKWQSENIRGENHPSWKGERFVMVCEQCGEESEVSPHEKDTRRFCSKACHNRWMSDNQRGKNNHRWKSRTNKKCKYCGKIFGAIPSEIDKLFCSGECYAKWQGENRCGENSPSWRGGISFEPYCPAFSRRFKEMIRSRFGRVCFLCQSTEEENGKKLCVHHVNYDKNCLCSDVDCEFVPLCMSCHSKTGGDRVFYETLITEMLKYDF